MRRSQHAIKQIVEAAVSAECGLPERGLWLCVDETEVSGKPLSRIQVWATLHFMPAGSPFRTCDPNEALGLYGDRLTAISERVRRAFGLRQEIGVSFAAITANIHQGVLDLEQVYLSVLTKQNCDVDACSSDGRTALMCYAGGAYADHTIVDMLLQAGANPTRRDQQGRTVMDHALTAEPTEQCLIVALLQDAITKMKRLS